MAAGVEAEEVTEAGAGLRGLAGAGQATGLRLQSSGDLLENRAALLEEPFVIRQRSLELNEMSQGRLVLAGGAAGARRRNALCDQRVLDLYQPPGSDCRSRMRLHDLQEAVVGAGKVAGCHPGIHFVAPRVFRFDPGSG